MRSRAVLLIVIALPLVVLGYGYWFGRTHGALFVYALDVTDREHAQEIKSISLAFLDTAGSTLAEARGVPPTGTIFLVSPPLYDCHGAEEQAPFSGEAMRAWDACFARQSRWVTTWIRRVRSVDIRLGSCTIRRLPVIVSEHPDSWWLWWLPVRHIGGKPYTSFNLQIDIDRSVMCQNFQPARR